MLVILIIVFMVGYWVGKSGEQADSSTNNQTFLLQRIINALVYTAKAEQDRSKSKAVKDALQRVIDAGYAEQYGAAPAPVPQPVEQQPVAASQPITAPTAPLQVAEQDYIQGPNLTQKTPAKQDLDNTSLLLYFGAFLFIASIGLFVAFSDFDGVFRTFMVGLIAIVMYSFGFWLYRQKKKLREVGLTFVGIGMSALPFVGLAAYYYVYDESYGPAIWLVTSLSTVVLYTLTLFSMRNTFVSYMLIASMVSLFEASVSVIEAPAYYYLWMLMGVGIVLHFISLFAKNLPELKDSSAISSRILIPLSLAMSLLVIGGEGTWQFAVTLLIASGYYLLQYFVVDKDKDLYALGSHVLFIGGLAVGAYSIHEDVSDVSLVLLAITALHIALISVIPARLKMVAARIIDVAAFTALAALLVSIGDSLNLTVAFALSIGLGVIVTYRTHRHDAFSVTVLMWVIFSVILGQVLPEDSINNIEQAGLSFLFTLPLLVLLFSKQIREMGAQWVETLQVGVVLLHVVSLVFAFLDGEYSVLWVSLAAVVSVLVLAEGLRERAWAHIAVLYSLVPSVYVIVALSDDELRALPLFTISVLMGLAINIAIALRYKIESARWASAAGWLALPFALGIEEIGAFDLSPSLQMWLYLATGIALSVSRAIARGRMFAAKHVPLESLDRESSFSYEVALGISTVVAIVLAFMSTGTVAESTMVIALAGMILIVGGTVIEREPQYVAFAPFVLQIVLLRLLEPYDSGSWLTQSEGLLQGYVAASSILACGAYWAASVAIQSASDHKEALKSLRDAAAVTLFVAPASFLVFGEVVIMMPISLIVASAVFMYDQWSEGIYRREGVSLIGLGGLYWLLFMLDVRNIHVYTHLASALAMTLAYIRLQRKERDDSEQYFSVALAVALGPLALHALLTTTEETAQIYMIWFAIESVLFYALGRQLQSASLKLGGFYGILGSLYGLMYVFGVRNIQAYSHLTAAIFAGYGYVAHKKGNLDRANEFWTLMLGAATIPLALQALGADSNNRLYGIWLLLENVVFLLIGITIRNKLITRWGLYFSIAVVLYELRDLGWALLSVLALVLIGIGAYRALNQPDEEPEK